VIGLGLSNQRKTERKKGRFPGVAWVNNVTPVSLGYPLLVFNKNSTLKERKLTQLAKKELANPKPQPKLPASSCVT